MTTRTPPTAADLDGTSERGKAAYQERQATLRRMGIVPAAEQPSIFDLDPEADEVAAADAFDAELKANERADEAAQRRLEADGWSTEGQRRRLH